MDFQQAQFEGVNEPPQVVCANCKTILEHQFWTAGPHTVCRNCADQLRAGPPKDGGFKRFVKAFLLGNGAGLLGAIGYGAIIYFTGYELALITIFIGWFVGRAVMLGSDKLGGRGYQVMGALLTYVWCVEAFVPMLVKGAMEGNEPPPFLFAALISPFIALALPFLGEMGPLGLLILAFGVFRGWREPQRIDVAVDGPFDLKTEKPPTVDAEPGTP
ncbi:MAG: hypothetical protein DI536_15475 [Archangium gephyra]|uniref:Uncharacterized protein n=1 Tax=Archangium gephyra TaxID=48 RepID=A0A2W5TBL8_9BACT|nr:MAG: hypothetical protein DI536_15475 [Archangium gephyra]